MKKQIGYWFSSLDGTTEYCKKPAVVGRTDKVQGEIIPCANGLHSSPTPWDALQYASGSMLWMVELGGEIVEHGKPVDKHASSSRKYIKCFDSTNLLRQFAARRALTVITKWSPSPVVIEYLNDTANGKDRTDIRAAAMAAARDAAWDAAMAAAWDAAWDAARAAARDAARAAAMAAARDAARAAAMAAAKKQFNDMVSEQFEKVTP